MTKLLNSAIIPVLNQNGMSIARIDNLVYIKEFIDRVSSKKYISDFDLGKIEKKYGVKPDIITWGDFFQAEIATEHATSEDDQFMKALETAKFDIISSYLIFHDKDSHFFDWVDSYEVPNAGDENMIDDETEIEHLKILKNYYIEMGLKNHFTEAEIAWHSSFKDAVAI